MGALRIKMIEEMRLRNFSVRTQESYVAAMVGLVKHYRKPPDQLSAEQIRSYLLHLEDRGYRPVPATWLYRACASFTRRPWVGRNRDSSLRPAKGSGGFRRCSAPGKSTGC